MQLFETSRNSARLGLLELKHPETPRVTSEIWNRALEYLQEHHCKIYVHTVITGGQALLDTLNGFRELAESAQQRNLVVWVNEYFGRVEAQGKTLSEMTAFRDSQDKVCGVVVIPKHNQDTFDRKR